MSALCQKQTLRHAAQAIAEAEIRSVELIVQPDATDVVGAMDSSKAIVQAKPNDVETIAEGCVE